jgi:glutamyl-tRNA reductase
VEAIVNAEVAHFMAWLHNLHIAPVITNLRHKALTVANTEVAEALHRLEGLGERDQQIIARLAHRIVNKLLHAPTMCLKTHSTNGNMCDYAQVVRELFALESDYDTACAYERTEGMRHACNDL